MMPTAENQMCFQCHSDDAGRSAARSKGLLTGGQGLLNVAADFAKISNHPLSGLAQTTSRSPLRATSGSLATVPSTLSCSDCHDSHYLVKAPATPPTTTQIKQIGNSRHGPSPEYSLCYRCHGTSAHTGVDIARLLRPGNPSYHPVEATGRSTDVPSLIQPYNAQSLIACTDCHGTDQAAGPRGPHGSAFDPILKAHYGGESGTSESAYEYALCYRCHSRASILSDTTFSKHKKHIVDKKASCRACHNSHGSAQYNHLIDFDTSIVSPSKENGQLRFNDLGTRRGSCSLLCHGEDHHDEGYD